MTIKEKINKRMDTIAMMMESNTHLKDPETVMETIASVSKFWSALEQDDRDYINAARGAIEDQLEWK